MKILVGGFFYLLVLTLVPAVGGAYFTARLGISWQQFLPAAVVAVSLGFILSLCTLYILWRMWIRPLNSLERFLQILGEGNPIQAERFVSTLRFSLALQGPVKGVLDNIFRIIGHMQRSSDELNYFVNNLLKGVTSVQSSFREITLAMQEIAGGADEQAGAAQRVAENMGVLTNLAEEIADRSRLGTQMAAEVQEKEREGRSLLEQLLKEIEEAAFSNERAAQHMRQLEEKMSQINEFVRIVTAIAEQTNLLSLNAAIEAARAGEQGRGFAVVADEVRKLAEQSAAAAQNITRLASEIQAEARETASQVERNVHLVKGNIERGRNAKTAFETIGQAIAKAVQAMEEINLRAEQQAERVRVVNEDAGRVAAVAQQTAASIEEVSAAASEQQTNMAKVEKSGQELADMAQNFFNMAAEYTKGGWDEATCQELARRGFEVLEGLASKPEVQSMELATLQPLLDQAFEDHSIIQTLFAVLPDGTALYSRPSTKITNWAFRPWFQVAMQGQKFATEPYITQATNRLAITISVPVKNEQGELVGVLAANLVPSDLVPRA
ncbi:methyl-accepting chemotaxis sensory transducer with Cache sensor [Thermanaeromonas toyohensis ToBE]|uniref:Methyl-accepting chemotaxis sensory transducer with Cache sensor n=1 Tax=Thermanaeromonas toyohensis ToBE TaxID=698762 RepID=A0A1W1W338_9FIRM|nr:methyl-accepting chemotaxis protein [Thermanaeromonas toyohensis]SMB99801.1 methyl-accepting chemotaxis sensory transducer with Cache sensor [Thermanaeromonas toyohensis ToBE]